MYAGSVILTDSRGRYLQDVVDNLTGYGPLVRLVPGATMNCMYNEIRDLQKNYQVSALYLLVGVNDTTWRDKHTSKTVPKYFTAEDLCSDITEKFELLLEYALHARNIPRVVITPVVGIDLARYNKDADPNPWQKVLDSGVRKLNYNIITLNAAHGLSTPLIHTSIYKSMGHGKSKTLYCRLWDGLHPRGDILERWAEGFIRAMELNGDWI